MARPRNRLGGVQPPSRDPQQDEVMVDADDMAPEFTEDTQESERERSSTPSDNPDRREGERESTPAPSEYRDWRDASWQRLGTNLEQAIDTETVDEDGGIALDRAPLHPSLLPSQPMESVESTQPHSSRWTIGDHVQSISDRPKKGFKRPRSSTILKGSTEEWTAKRVRSKEEPEDFMIGQTSNQPPSDTSLTAPAMERTGNRPPSKPDVDVLAMEWNGTRSRSREVRNALAIAKSSIRPPTEKAIKKPRLTGVPPGIGAVEMASTRLVEYARTGESTLRSSSKLPSSDTVDVVAKTFATLGRLEQRQGMSRDDAMAFFDEAEGHVEELRRGVRLNRAPTRVDTPGSPSPSDDEVKSLEKRQAELIAEVERYKRIASESGIDIPLLADRSANPGQSSTYPTATPWNPGPSPRTPPSAPETAENQPPRIPNPSPNRASRPSISLLSSSDLLNTSPPGNPLVDALRRRPPEEFYRDPKTNNLSLAARICLLCPSLNA
ncbi:hypothetical protein BU16DRAFT_3940 [Lophium mytilinum]|uniref:Uncharacterized protein n=1 Tax=Lophium mytilinum TaxID=390894 RepID=A0A6A6REW5_9PEZI|nr:hypothetical protein BU16DRAFT_3940 [Lophium mytilinum]